jgi:hypothetical protein
MLDIIRKINTKTAAIITATTVALTVSTGSAFGFEIPSVISNLLPPELVSLYNSGQNLYNNIQTTYQGIATLASDIAANPSLIGQMGAVDFQKYYEQAALNSGKQGGDVLDASRATGQAATATGTAILSTDGQKTVAEQVKAQNQYVQSAEAAAQKAVNATSSLQAIGANTQGIAAVSKQIGLLHAATVQGNQTAASMVQSQATTNAELEKAANDRDNAKAEMKQLVKNQFVQPLMERHEINPDPKADPKTDPQ